MTPQLAFDEIGIVLTTMTTGVQMIYFILVTALNLLGLYIQDMQIDKAKAQTDTAKPYELEWKELAPYAIVSATFTMAIFEIYAIQFWQSMVFAILMGMIFRTILPEIVKIFAEKIKAIIEAMFGK